MRLLTGLMLMLSVLFSTGEIFGQDCRDCRYISPIFDSVTVETVQFGQGPRANGDIQDLYMDIYQPYGDTAVNRPVAIFAFGGAFITGSRNDWYVELVGEYLAQLGYVAVAIDYRIYDGIGEMIGEILALQHMRIFFRPMQDMRAAVQYMKADYSELGNNYRIDTSRILIGGASSGAMTSLMTAYCDKPSELAEMGFGELTPINALGGFYSTSGFYPNYNWKNVLATFNVAGSIVNTDWIEPGDVPIILTHGDDDHVVPYKEGGFAGLTVGSFDMQGSYLIDSVARAKGVCSYLYTMVGKDHPSEDYGIEYFKSVLHRLALRMHAVVNGRSFCCGLELNVEPVDTLFYESQGDTVSLKATIKNDNGNAELKWCGIPCQFTGTSSTIEIQPDTNLGYVSCIAYEGQCQAVALNMVRQGSPYIPDTTTDTIGSSSHLIHRDGAFLKIYPQPASGTFTVSADFTTIQNRDVTISIFDLTGKKVFSQQVFVVDKLNEQIDVNGLSGGSYLLTLSSNEIMLREKLVISR